jgi:hypothetical protein
MAFVAQPAQVQPPPTRWQQFWQWVIEKIWLLSGHYLLVKKNRDLWRERPDIRRKIMINIGWFWAYGWILASGAILLWWRFNYLLPFFSLGLAAGVFLFFYLVYGRTQTALTMAAFLSIVVIFWLLMVNIPVFLFGANDVHLSPLALFFADFGGFYAPYMLWGLGWIVFVYFVMLSMPIWMITIHYGEVYLVEDQHTYPDHFRLISRPSPKVDKEVINGLVAGGLPRDLIDTFIRFNGPTYMRKPLADKIGPDADHVTRRMLQLLFEQAADRARTTAPVLWVSALDNERLIWDRKRSVSVNDLIIDQLVTKDGHPIKILLEFSCSFDPESIRKPEFRLGLVNIRSIQQMEDRIRAVISAGAISTARLYFIHLPLRDALTQGAIEDFRGDFPLLMEAFQSLGIVVNSASVLCRPVIDPEVQLAETEYLASRAAALKDTAKLQALIDKVMLHGVPPDLLAGLLFLDQSTTGPNKAFQLKSETDIRPLPEATNQQQARYLYQKFRGDVPRDYVPELPAGTQKELPPGDDRDDTLDASQSRPDWFGRGDRFNSNIGDQKKRD